jgi:hypothetical protein
MHWRWAAIVRSLQFPAYAARECEYTSLDARVHSLSSLSRERAPRSDAEAGGRSGGRDMSRSNIHPSSPPLPFEAGERGSASEADDCSGSLQPVGISKLSFSTMPASAKLEPRGEGQLPQGPSFEGIPSEHLIELQIVLRVCTRARVYECSIAIK